MSDPELGEGLTCFIVGPIGDRLEPPGTEGRLRYENATQMWENVFEPACAVFSLIPVRGDKIAGSGEIPEQIFTYLRDADVVIADLTGGNANVMYELGLRHTRDKITIQVGEHERLPFDVNTIRTVKFKRSEAGLIDARNSLVEALRAALKGDSTPVTATRVWDALGGLNADDVARASALSFVNDDPADTEDDDTLGRLDLLAQGEVALERIGAILGDFSSHMQEMTAVNADIAPRLTDTKSFAARLTLVKHLADDLKSPAAKMDTTSGNYYESVEQIDEMMAIVIDELTTNPEPLADDGVQTFAAAVVEMCANAEGANVSFTGALQAVREMRKWSKLLRPASKSIEHSLNTVLRGNMIVAGWAGRFREVPGWVEPASPDSSAD